MKEAKDGKPQVGTTFGSLGVRAAEVAPDPEGLVAPGKGGLSVFESPDLIPVGFRPRAFGGQGELPLWEPPKDLPRELKLRKNPKTGHGEIEPAYKMPLADFQAALASTRDRWKRVEQRSEKS